MRRDRSVRVALALALAVAATELGSVGVARAQPSGQDVATAQGLFDEGKRLMQAGKLDEGCPKLVESQRLDPAGGTLLVIALCHEAQGKTATAWAEFGVALGEARKDKRADREAAALEHIKALEPKLTRLRVLVPASSKLEGLEVRRDGARVGDAQWGTPLPIDPGEHVFEARAPGKRTWSKPFAVKGEGAVVDVTIPLLEDEPNVAPAPVVTPSPTPAPTTTTPPSPAPDSSEAWRAERSTRLTWAAIAGGAGLVASGVGIAFAASASSKWKDAENACPNLHCKTEADRKLGRDAGTAADISTVFFVVGAVAAATGVVLWLTAPNGAPEAARVRVVPVVTGDSGGVVLGGAL